MYVMMMYLFKIYAHTPLIHIIITPLIHIHIHVHYFYTYVDINIAPEAAAAIADTLEHNNTLTSLTLRSM